MTNKEKQEVDSINSLIKYLEKDFIGKNVCKEFHPDCASCKANILRGYLEWLKDVLEIIN